MYKGQIGVNAKRLSGVFNLGMLLRILNYNCAGYMRAKAKRLSGCPNFSIEITIFSFQKSKDRRTVVRGEHYGSALSQSTEMH